MKSQLIAAAAICAIALSGCQGVALNGPVALDGLRPAGGPCDPLSAPNFRVVSAVAADIEVGGKTYRCPAHEIGMHLKPGMVLRLATPTWGPALGSAILTADQSGTDANGDPLPAVGIPLAAGNRAPQIASELRLPVRKLGVSGRLTDEEATVLGAFLSLQRKERFGATDDAGSSALNTSTEWRKMLSRTVARAALWNAFVDASSLRRITPATDIAPEPQHQQPLSLVVNPSEFCKYARSPKKGTDPSLALSASELSLLISGLRFGAFDCTTYTENVEAFALRTHEARADPLAAIVVQRGPLNNGYFLDDVVANPASFVSAELGAVSMRADGAERKWSLAEWEESAICGPGRQIAKVDVPGTLQDFAIVGRADSPRTATFSVIEEVSTAGISRRIASIEGNAHLQLALQPADLSRLRPSDINNLAWTADWGGSGRDPCRR